MRRYLVTAVLGLVCVAGVVSAVASAGDGPLPAGLQGVRAAVARCHSAEQAARDGYVRASACESSPGGAMGYHYANFARIADPALDPLRPEVLLYLPGDDGELKLVAVEYLKVVLAGTTPPRPWIGPTPPAEAFVTPRPSLFGRAFDGGADGGPMPGHNPTMPWHYDLHVWVAEENPDGVFAQWNPALRCP